MKRTILLLAIALAAGVPPAVVQKARQEAPSKGTAVDPAALALLERAQPHEGQANAEGGRHGR